jgi:hypothetical protein
MSRRSAVLLRIAGGATGLLIGGVSAGVLLYWPAALPSMLLSEGPEDALGLWILIFGVGVLGGAAIGAAVGATKVQACLGRGQSSFWRALLGAVAGLLVGIPCALTGYGILLVPILIVGGAVVGSSWRTERANEALG